MMRFDSGALGVLEATTCAIPHDFESSLSVLGDRGTVEVGGNAGNQMKIWAFSDSTAADEKILQEFGSPEMSRVKVGHIRFYESVIDSLRGNALCDSDGQAGRRSVEVISAIYESMETGQEISLRFKPKYSRLGRPEYA